MSEVIEQTEEIEAATEEPVIEYPYVVAVKFKNATKAYSFGTNSPDFVPGEWVVVETAQGLELGEVQA